MYPVLGQTLWTSCVSSELCYLFSAPPGSLAGWLLQQKEGKCLSFAQAEAAQQMRPVVQSSGTGHNTTCQEKVCILGESFPMCCFHHCSQQGGQTEEWAAGSWREKGSGNLLFCFLFFFSHRENKKEKAAPLGSYTKCSLQELCLKRSWKDFDCSCRKEMKQKR